MSKPDREQLERMRRAIAALLDLTQAIYRLHLFDGLDYAAIGARLALDCREVERHIADAIVGIDSALREPDPPGQCS